MTVLAVPEKAVINLSRLRWDHRVAGLRNMGSWHMGQRETDEHQAIRSQPCMVLARPDTRLDRITPCIVLLDTAYLWTVEVGDHTWAANRAMKFAPALGLDPFHLPDVFRILDCVRERLDDLIQMPPIMGMVGRGEIVGDLTFRLGAPDAPVIQKDIWDHE